MNQQVAAVSPVEELFSGEAMPLGGLSNEEELVKLCPREFYEPSNPWSTLGMKIFHKGAVISNWKWKSDDLEVKEDQAACLHGLLGTYNIGHHDKRAVAGWMLSEMLSEVPEHIVPQPD